MKHASALVSIEYSIADTQWQKGLPHNADVHGNLYFYWIPVQWKLLCRRPIMLLFVCKTKLTALTPTFTACMLYVATMKPLCSVCTQHCCKKPPRPLHPPHSPSQAIQCSACPVVWNTVLQFFTIIIIIILSLHRRGFKHFHLVQRTWTQRIYHCN